MKVPQGERKKTGSFPGIPPGSCVLNLSLDWPGPIHQSNWSSGKIPCSCDLLRPHPEEPPNSADPRRPGDPGPVPVPWSSEHTPWNLCSGAQSQGRRWAELWPPEHHTEPKVSRLSEPQTPWRGDPAPPPELLIQQIWPRKSVLLTSSWQMLGLNQSCSLQPMPQPQQQQLRIQATSVTYTTAHGNPLEQSQGSNPSPHGC